MFELYQTAISPHQILFTVLLGMVVLYWLMVILGGADFDHDMPGTDADVHVDGQGHGGDGHADGHHHHHHPISTGGIWLNAGRFIGFSQVPLVIWMSFMIVFGWLFSLALNEWYNPERDTGRAFLLLLPNGLASLIFTKLTILPIAKMLQAMAEAQNEGEKVIGRAGIIVSMDVSEATGQVEITTVGAPLLINARTRPGEPALTKGTRVTVTSEGPDHAFYFIESLKS